MPKGVRSSVPTDEEVIDQPIVDETSEEVDEEVETKPKSKNDIGSVDVVTEAGKLVRSYSASQHGKDYKDLAKEFVAKNEGYKLA